MSQHTFTGIFSFTFIEGNSIIYKYTTTQCTDPRKYKTLEKFKNEFDLNNLWWTTSIDAIYDSAKINENIRPTSHGIVKIDYTKEEYLTTKIMYVDEYRYLLAIKNILCYGFNFILTILYLAFIIKLYNCLA